MHEGFLEGTTFRDATNAAGDTWQRTNSPQGLLRMERELRAL